MAVLGVLAVRLFFPGSRLGSQRSYLDQWFAQARELPWRDVLQHLLALAIERQVQTLLRVKKMLDPVVHADAFIRHAKAGERGLLVEVDRGNEGNARDRGAPGKRQVVAMQDEFLRGAVH